MSRQEGGPYRRHARSTPTTSTTTGSFRGHHSRHAPPPSSSSSRNSHRAHGISRLNPIEQEINLVTNAYSLISQKTNIKVYEYDLTISPSAECKDLPVKVLARAFVSRSIRQLIMQTIMPQLTPKSCPLGSVLVEPNLNAIYSIRQLKLQEGSSNCREFKFANLTVVTDLITNLSIDIVIRFHKSSSINPVGHSAQLLSSIIHHQLLIDMLKYGPVYYLMNDQSRPSGQGRRANERLDLISQHFLGISLSNARRCSEDQSIVVISCSNSYITKSYRLIDLLASFIAGKTVDNVRSAHPTARGSSSSSSSAQRNSDQSYLGELTRIDGSEEWFASFCSILTGFKCQVSDQRGANLNLRFTLTDKSAANTMIDEGISVKQYYSNQGIQLSYPNLPCLISRQQQNPYHPLEMCSLLAGQKVPIFRLSAQARNHLTTVNKPNPTVSKESSSRARDEVVNLGLNQFNAFGVELSSNPVEATGHALAKPILQFRTSRLDPERDFWESGVFNQSVDLVDNWCVVDTVGLDPRLLDDFFTQFSYNSRRFGFNIERPRNLRLSKSEITERSGSLESLIHECSKLVSAKLRFIMFIIDSSSTNLNRMIHLTFDEHPTITATCLRAESVQNQRLYKSIHRTLVHKLNARLGGTNVIYNEQTWRRLNLDNKGLMIIGLDVTHPDNELNGVSIVGCAYTYSSDLFRHRSLVWPQTARVEIIGKMDSLMRKLLAEYRNENKGQLPTNIIVYRDGVSHEEFSRVRSIEISKATAVIDEVSNNHTKKPILSYVIAQKRHMMRFFRVISPNQVYNPPGGTLIHQGIVAPNGDEFYLYSNTSPQATARPLHYHVLLDGLGIENLQKLTYYLCFNFAKCSSSLSMPSSLRYAHNAAYDARNRVIASREFNENKFYTTKFFC